MYVKIPIYANNPHANNIINEQHSVLQQFL